LGALKSLVSFYTIFHMNITQEDMDAMETRFHLTPLVGVIFGTLLLLESALLVWLFREYGFGSGMATAVLMLLTVYAGSKFLHFDGLTDFGDGMIVSGQQSDHIRALKDTLVGAGGIGVAMITVLCSVAFYSMYGNDAVILLAFPVIEVFVKHAMVVAAANGKPGKGMAARQVERTTGRSAILSLVISFIAFAILSALGAVLMNTLFDVEYDFAIKTAAIFLAVGFIVSTIMGLVMSRTANRVFGMVNGDILGATNEVTRPFLAFFLFLAFRIALELSVI
jgi:adenosylcobinamide-GDP ribazoletransferase